MMLSGELAGFIAKSGNAVEDYPVSFETHDLYIEEKEDEVAIVFRPKGAPSKGRGNMSSSPAVTIIFDRASGEIVKSYYVR